jgi:hypothetical protein
MKLLHRLRHQIAFATHTPSAVTLSGKRKKQHLCKIANAKHIRRARNYSGSPQLPVLLLTAPVQQKRYAILRSGR